MTVFGSFMVLASSPSGRDNKSICNLSTVNISTAAV